MDGTYEWSFTFEVSHFDASFYESFNIQVELICKVLMLEQDAGDSFPSSATGLDYIISSGDYTIHFSHFT